MATALLQTASAANIIIYVYTDAFVCKVHWLALHTLKVLEWINSLKFSETFYCIVLCVILFMGILCGHVSITIGVLGYNYVPEQSS